MEKAAEYEDALKKPDSDLALEEAEICSRLGSEYFILRTALVTISVIYTRPC
jgi:hypothetical protein